VYPEYLWGHMAENMDEPQSPDNLFLKTMELYKEWYDVVDDEFHGMSSIIHS
jgi:hypothetical protein